MSTVPSDLEAPFASRVVRAADADYDELRKHFRLNRSIPPSGG